MFVFILTLTKRANGWVGHVVLAVVVLDAVVGVGEVSPGLGAVVVRILHAIKAVAVPLATVDLRSEKMSIIDVERREKNHFTVGPNDIMFKGEVL